VHDGWAMPSQLADMVERVAEIRIRQDPTAINHNKEKVRGGGGPALPRPAYLSSPAAPHG
jgi:hypothetical protein